VDVNRLNQIFKVVFITHFITLTHIELALKGDLTACTNLNSIEFPSFKSAKTDCPSPDGLPAGSLFAVNSAPDKTFARSIFDNLENTLILFTFRLFKKAA
jgi:hypothetical protein